MATKTKTSHHSTSLPRHNKTANSTSQLNWSQCPLVSSSIIELWTIYYYLVRVLLWCGVGITVCFLAWLCLTWLGQYYFVATIFYLENIIELIFRCFLLLFSGLVCYSCSVSSRDTQIVWQPILLPTLAERHNHWRSPTFSHSLSVCCTERSLLEIPVLSLSFEYFGIWNFISAIQSYFTILLSGGT